MAQPTQVNINLSTWTANKTFSLNKEIPSFLISGSYLCKWDEDASHLQDCLVKVDGNGFFLCYQEDDKEAICIDLCHISDIREGLVPKDTKTKDALQFLGSDPLESCTITIVYGPNLVDVTFLNFMFASSKTAQEWVSNLRSLIHNHTFQNPDVMLLLRKHYTRICLSLNSNKRISLKTIAKLLSFTKFEQRIADTLEGLNVTVQSKEIEPNQLSFEIFVKLYLTICPRTDIDTIFLKRSGGKSLFLSPEQFLTFLNKEQRDHRLNETIHPMCDMARAVSLIQKFETNKEMAEKGRLTMDGLYRFILSDECSILKSSSLEKKHDMSHPLNDYFINSSHNTYLVGRQFGGKSSVEMYRQSLLSGCRCIELDCHDGPGDEPIITHGKAMCTNVLFQDVIVAIKESAFITSPYPVILSFENRCSRSQQRKLAKYCVEIFGDMLLSKALDNYPLEDCKVLPPPENMLYRILIKNKKLRPEIEQLELESLSETASSLQKESIKTLPLFNGEIEVIEASDNEMSTASNDSINSLTESSNTTEPQNLLMRPSELVKRLSIISERSVDDGDDTANSTKSVSLPGSPKLTLLHRNRSQSEILWKDGSVSPDQVFFANELNSFSNSTSPILPHKSIVPSGPENIVKLLIDQNGGTATLKTETQGMWRCHVRTSGQSSDTSLENITNDQDRLEGSPRHEVANGTDRERDATSQRSSVTSTDSYTITNHTETYRTSREISTTSTRSLQSITSSDSSIDNEPIDFTAVEERLGRRTGSFTSHTSTSSTNSTRIHKRNVSGSTRTTNSATSNTETEVSTTHQSKGNIDPLLSSLVNYIQPCPFPGFDQSEERNLCYKMSSFNETAAFSVLKGNPVEFNKYNCRQISRIYPKGSRVDSSNYNPQVFWNVGCQLVSLNLQTSDLPFQLNQGKFEANGQSGYLLKPEVMRRSGRMFDAFTESPLDGVVPITVSVKVISGQFLTEKRVNTYVVVEVYGLPTDTERKHKTRPVASRGQTLNWIYETNPFVFRKIVLPELALIRFAVFDESDKLLGQRVLPLDSVEPGYRHVPLKTEANVPSDMATLLVFFVLETYVPPKYGDIVNELFDPIKFQNEADKRAVQMQVFEMEDDEEIECEQPQPTTSESTADESQLNRQRPQTVSSRLTTQATTRSRESVVTLTVKSKSLHSPQNSHSDIINGGEYRLQPVTLDELKKDKGYQKLVKRHQKEVENIFKKHEKERISVQRSHTTQVEKLVSLYDKNVQNEERAFERALKRANVQMEEKLRVAFDQKVNYLKKDHQEKLAKLMPLHNSQNADAVGRHIQEEVGVRCYQVSEQLEFLKQLLRRSQEDEIKTMKERHAREMTELQKRQTRKSIDDAKALSLDRDIKSKEEKERLQRERDKVNLEAFKQERQMKKRMAGIETDKLMAKHREELERMSEDYTMIMAVEKEKYREATSARKQTFSM